jgi:hypothetical protein
MSPFNDAGAWQGKKCRRLKALSLFFAFESCGIVSTWIRLTADWSRHVRLGRCADIAILSLVA